MLAPLSDQLKLVQSGLDSLSFAIIVARLEDSLGVDPFIAAETEVLPVTFGDFVRLYERFAKCVAVGVDKRRWLALGTPVRHPPRHPTR